MGQHRQWWRLRSGGPSSGSATFNVSGGTLTIDLSHATTQTNLVNPFYALQLGGGTIALNESASSGGSLQTFNGLTLNKGGSAVVVSTNGNTSATGFALGAITRNTGSTLDFTPGGASTGSITTSTINGSGGILGGWATVAGTNWAVTGASGTNPVTPLSSYTANAWASGNNTDITTSATYSGTTNSVRFNSAGDTVTLSGASTLTSGGILVTSGAGAAGATFGGAGSLTSSGTDLIVNQFDTSGSLTISNAIIGNTVGLTKSGPGTLILTGTNTYGTAAAPTTTTIGAGTLVISADNNLGTDPTSATADVIIGGGATLTGDGSSGNAFTLAATRTIALGPTTGVGNATIQVNQGVTMTVAGVIANNGTSVTSLTKSGPGTLILTAANTFTGGVYINQGIVFQKIATATTSSFPGTTTGSSSTSGLTNAGTVTFAGTTGVWQWGNATWSMPEFANVNIAMTSGANAVLDNNSVGANTGQFWGIITGQGNMTFMSSTGNGAGSYIRVRSVDSSASTYLNTWNWTYTGQTTVYCAVNETYESFVNGVQPSVRYNPNNVMNLGGGAMLGTVADGAATQTNGIQTLATYVNVIGDTSAEIGNGPTLGATNTLTMYLNSVSSNGLVRNPGSTLGVDLSGDMLIAHNAVANGSGGIIGGWCIAGTNSNGSTVTPGTDWASVATVSGSTFITQLGAPGSGGSYATNTWSAGSNTDITAASNSFSGATNSVRFNPTAGAGTYTLNMAAGTNVITTGGILLAQNSNAVSGVITGGG